MKKKLILTGAILIALSGTAVALVKNNDFKSYNDILIKYNNDTTLNCEIPLKCEIPIKNTQKQIKNKKKFIMPKKVKKPIIKY